MDPSNPQKQLAPEEPRLLDFPHLPDNATTPEGQPRLNKYSSTITNGHDFPGAQVGTPDCQIHTKNQRLMMAKGDVVRRWGPRPRVNEE